MKLLHYHFGRDGGAEAFFVRLVNSLATRGVEQKAVIRPGRRWRADIEPVAEVVAESHFRNTHFHRLWLPLRVNKLIREWKPDAILAWMSRAGHLLPRNAPCLRFGRLGDYPDRLTQFHNADVLICNAPGLVDRVRELGWTRPVEVVSNFTSIQRAAPIAKAELDTPADAPVICSVGRMVPTKGFDALIRALAMVPGAYLWIVGDGPEQANLQRLAHQTGVAERVRFAGWRDDPRPLVAAADVFATASAHEALGNVILEAWAQQVPVVSTKSQGPKWLIQDGGNGLLAEIGDAEGIARAVGRVLADAQLASRLIRGGTHSLSTRFSEQAIVDRYMNVLFGKRHQAAA